MYKSVIQTEVTVPLSTYGKESKYHRKDFLVFISKIYENLYMRRYELKDYIISFSFMFGGMNIKKRGLLLFGMKTTMKICNSNFVVEGLS